MYDASIVEGALKKENLNPKLASEREFYRKYMPTSKPSMFLTKGKISSHNDSIE